jgi:hypothetical protein
LYGKILTVLVYSDGVQVMVGKTQQDIDAENAAKAAGESTQAQFNLHNKQAAERARIQKQNDIDAAKEAAEKAKKEMDARRSKLREIHPAQPQEQKQSISDMVNHLNSYNPEGIAVLALMNLCQFGLEISVGWMFNYAGYHSEFSTAQKEGYAFEKNPSTGLYPTLYPQGADGKPDFSQDPLSEEQKEQYYRSSWDSNSAVYLLENGYMPPPSKWLSWVNGVTNLIDNVQGKAVVDNMSPNMRRALAQTIEEAKKEGPEKSEGDKLKELQTAEAARKAAAPRNR